MHEMALMGDILQIIEADLEKRQLKRIASIDLLIGEVSNVMPEAIEMAFDIFKEQNKHFFTSNAELTIQTEEASAICTICELQYKPTMKIALCPHCNFPSGKITKGATFEIISYEGR